MQGRQMLTLGAALNLLMYICHGQELYIYNTLMDFHISITIAIVLYNALDTTSQNSENTSYCAHGILILLTCNYVTGQKSSTSSNMRQLRGKVV